MNEIVPLIHPPPYEEHTRYNFIKNIFSILYLQLIYTFGICILFISKNKIKEYIQTSRIMFMLSIVLNILIIIILYSTSKKQKYNIFLLILFTTFTSYITGLISSHFTFDSIIISSYITFLIVLLVILFVFQIRYDFTKWKKSYILLIVLTILFLFGIFDLTLNNDMYTILYSIYSSILFIIYTIFDINLIIGGNNKKYEYKYDEKIYAIISLYLDIINLYLFILILYEMS